ncbi:MAG TPA: SDR family NAD(P)-dependent oxidoreductase [Motilibacterales bacterium]|nr:SDR family NAD(P)-dependent oxidoreductase [Motilibacterales bacterium]
MGLDSSLDLTGRVALVTGGASGIGAGVSRLLAGAGAHVAVCDVDLDGAAALAAEIGAMALRCDVSVLADNRSAVAAAVDAFGGLDLVVLNAGVDSLAVSLDRLDEVAYRRAMGVNLDGVVFGLAAALPALSARGGGRVVVLASMAGLAPVPIDPIYAANKAAVVNLVRSVGPGLAAQGIVVNAVCPGFTDTAIVDPVRGLLGSMGVPLMPVDEVVSAIGTVLQSDAAGEAWLVQHGHPAQPYRFRGVPAPAPAGSPGSP